MSRKVSAMVALLGATLALGLSPSALAGGGGSRGDDAGQPSPPPQNNKPNDITSRVEFSLHNVPKAGGTPMAPVRGGQWEPPACWYEPRYSPEEFSAYATTVDVRHGEGTSREGGVRAKYPDMHIGDKGQWYIMRYDTSSTGGTPQKCLDQDGFVFVGPDDPAPTDAPVLDPEILAGLAYRKTTLPAPPLALSPKPKQQVVNLATHARFAKKLGRVWVTAAIQEAGLDLAATTVAEPATLRLVAGTDDADPASCTYDVAESDGGGYAVDTEDADCNLTYRRVTAKGAAHTLKAYLTWRVSWAEGDSPDGTPRHQMPDGESVDEVAVTVKEIQAISRD